MEYSMTETQTDPSPWDGLIERMQGRMMVAGQCSVEGPEDTASLMAQAEAEFLRECLNAIATARAAEAAQHQPRRLRDERPQPWRPRPVFYGVPLESAQDVVFVLDRSSSMSESDASTSSLLTPGVALSALGSIASIRASILSQSSKR